MQVLSEAGKSLVISCLLVHMPITNGIVQLQLLLKKRVYTFTGLDYWTDIFLVFTHVVVGLIDFHWLGVLRQYLAYP